MICIVEAMKMENAVHAHRAGKVTDLSVAPGQPVTTGQTICILGGEDSDDVLSSADATSPAP